MSSLPETATADPATPAVTGVAPPARDEDTPRVVSASGLNWLRAGVLGANDGIVSVAATVLGVAGATSEVRAIFIAGIAALVAGALSMAVGEYVSVSSQRDAEQSDIAKEKEELATQPDAELHELAGIYVKRGLDKHLAMQVAKQLSAHDQLGAHLRDELGIDAANHPRPLQAAVVSGDSGGPVLDSDGEVVGMTTAASSNPGTTIAYAITIENALAVVHQIESGSTADGVTIGYPAFLGVAFSSGSSLPGLGGDGLGTTTSGAPIAAVIDGTPASSIGLAAGDTITKVDGTAVSSSDELAAALATHKPGDKVTVTWVSGTTGASSSATVTLIAGPAN